MQIIDLQNDLDITLEELGVTVQNHIYTYSELQAAMLKYQEAYLTAKIEKGLKFLFDMDGSFSDQDLMDLTVDTYNRIQDEYTFNIYEAEMIIQSAEGDKYTLSLAELSMFERETDIEFQLKAQEIAMGKGIPFHKFLELPKAHSIEALTKDLPYFIKWETTEVGALHFLTKVYL